MLKALNYKRNTARVRRESTTFELIATYTGVHRAMPYTTVDPENPTLEAAQAQFNAGKEKGVTCLCCGRYGKLYKRKLSSNMARGLITLHRMTLELQSPHSGWLNLTGDIQGGLPGQTKEFLHDLNHWELHKLQHWGLIQTRESNDPAHKGSGIWRLTCLGTAFVMSEVTVPKHILLLDNEFQGFGDEITDMPTAWGDRFNFRELMEANSHPPYESRKSKRDQEDEDATSAFDVRLCLGSGGGLKALAYNTPSGTFSTRAKDKMKRLLQIIRASGIIVTEEREQRKR